MKTANIDKINRKFLDVEYDIKSQSQKLDIYLPEVGEGPFPVIVSIHGGAFKMGDKRDHQLEPMLKGLDRGYAVVSINYRLSGEAIWPAQIFDVKRAIEFIKLNAKEYELDSSKVAVWGGSAGGHLSAMVGTSAYCDKLNNKDAKVDVSVNAVVDWFGPIDFLKMDEQLIETGAGRPDHNYANSPESELLGDKITDVEDLVEEANPMTYIHRDIPPFFIQHGRIDNLVPYQQSENLYKKIVETAGKDKAQFEILEGARHGGPHFEESENVEKVFAFLDKIMK